MGATNGSRLEAAFSDVRQDPHFSPFYADVTVSATEVYAPPCHDLKNLSIPGGDLDRMIAVRGSEATGGFDPQEIARFR